MTSVTVPQSLGVSLRLMWGHVLSDTSVTKFALGCATVALGMILGTFAYIFSVGGDVAAISLAISGFLSTLVGTIAGAFKRKNGSGQGA